jgi:phosphate/phosphite/phosphonate ABC transporter binding protein
MTSLLAETTVKIGVLAKRSSDITIKKYAATAAYLTQEVQEYNFEIVPLSFQELQESVAQEKIDFVLTNTMYYVTLESLYGISRIATLKNIHANAQETTSFGAVIIVPASSSITTFEELKGKRFGAVDALSLGGWVMAQRELQERHIFQKDFASFTFFGSHDKVVLAVCNGTIDAGTVRSDTLEKMQNEGLIDSSCYRVIEPKKYNGFPFLVSTRLYPEWPFAKLLHTPELLSNKVTIALLQMPTSSQAAIDAKIAGWTIPLDYTQVHELLQDLHLGPYSELGKLTLERFYEEYKAIFWSILLLFVIIIVIVLYIAKLNAKLKSSNLHIERLNETLEQKVQNRTAKLKKMYFHEKYLKDILESIADINELLITSVSTKNVIENSIDGLVKNRNYALVWISLQNNNALEMSIQSKESNGVIQTRNYDLQTLRETLAVQIMEESIKSNKTIIKELPRDYDFSLNDELLTCEACWMISLPITTPDDDNVLGNLCVFSIKEDGFELQEITMLENLATDIGLALNSVFQRAKLQLMELEKVSNYEETILAFVNIIEQRDSYTAGHTLRVAKYCGILAQAIGIAAEDIIKLEKAAILHDIGKVVTPDSILLKPNDLTQLEYELIKEHANAGYRMLSKIKMYQDLADIIRYHHTRYDGKGYPATDPNNPEEIPMLSYIMTVADAFDAMTTNRIYKPKKTVQEALEEIAHFSGTQFHPKIAKIAQEALKDVDVTATSQMPKSELEERRFAYFFRDSLTEIYNETYLQIILNKAHKKEQYLYKIELKRFSNFNKMYGWKQGDLLLKSFADALGAKYPNAMLFRYHGDDFLILFEEYFKINKEDIEAISTLKKHDLEVAIEYYNLKERVPEL